MDEKILKLFADKNILLKNLKSIDMSEIVKTRTIIGYMGVNLDGFYQIVLIRSAKSKFILKDMDLIEQICLKIENKFDIKIKKRVLFYNSPACKKAINQLIVKNWKCYDFV